MKIRGYVTHDFYDTLTGLSGHRKTSWYGGPWKSRVNYYDAAPVWGSYGVCTSWRTEGKPARYSRQTDHLFSLYKVTIDYSYSLVEKKTAYNYTVYDGSYFSKYGLPPMSTQLTPSPEIDELAEKAISDVYRKASKPYAPGVHWLGELRETITAMKQPLSGLRTLLRKAKNKAYKKNRAQRADHMRRWRRKNPNGNASHERRRMKRKWDNSLDKDLADAYLEYQYGIQPLIGMADGIAEKAANQLLRGKTATHRSIHKLEKTTFNDQVPGSVSSVQWEYEEVEKIVAYCQMKVNYGLSNNRRKAAQRYMNRFKRYKTGPTFVASGRNLVAQLWELFPLSFVINWVVDIKRMLEESSPTVGTPYSFTLTTKHTVTRTYRCTKWSYYDIIVQPSATITTSQTTRTLNPTRPGGLHWGEGVNLSKSLSALALGISNFR